MAHLEIIGPYRILEPLAAGAFGRVYRAERMDRPGHLALKILSPHASRSTPHLVAALRDEARLLDLIRSPHVVGSHGLRAIPDEGGGEWQVLVLDFVQGVTLVDLATLVGAMPGKLPLSAAAQVAQDTLSGLTATHDAQGPRGHLGVVHRDLKPANVMVDEAGVTRILDLGIAWARDRGITTEPGLTKGTPPWMSPEQIQGGTLGPRSDLYVLGILLFELLSGEPWVPPRGPGRGDEDVMADCLSRRFNPRRTALREGMATRFAQPRRGAGTLEELLADLLAPKPKDRPPRASVAAARLRPALADVEESRLLLGRVARGIRVGRESEARRADADATQVVPT